MEKLWVGELKKGEIFQENLSDSVQLIIESAVRYMNLKEPIGKVLRDGENSATIVGVVEDFLIEAKDKAYKVLEESKHSCL